MECLVVKCSEYLVLCWMEYLVVSCSEEPNLHIWWITDCERQNLHQDQKQQFNWALLGDYLSKSWTKLFQMFCFNWRPPGGLVIKVPGYGFIGPGFDSRRYQIFWEVVGLEGGRSVSWVQLRSYLKVKVAAPVWKAKNTSVGICAMIY
jgi:hypothetical protein